MSQKKILIVEDDLNVRDLERKILEPRGFQVIEAANAKDGVDLALTELPDLIIMDIRLPSKKRGIGAARMIRKDPRMSEVPVIFVTGYVGGDKTAEIANIPKSEYLLKPFSVQELVDAINKYI